MQIILVDFSKSDFDTEFRETCVCTLSNFSTSNNVRLLVHNSLQKMDFYKELVRTFGYGTNENIQCAAGTVLANFMVPPFAADFPNIFMNIGIVGVSLKNLGSSRAVRGLAVSILTQLLINTRGNDSVGEMILLTLYDKISFEDMDYLTDVIATIALVAKYFAKLRQEIVSNGLIE